jgi:hypothetical protein
MMTREAESVKATECTVSLVKCVVEITTPRGSDRYTVDALNPGAAGVKGFRLSKHGKEGLCYDVVQGSDGIVSCDCADYEFRRKGRTAEPCKHGSSLVSLGLLAAPAVAPSPEPRRHVADVFAGGPDDPAPCRTCVAPAESDAAFIGRLEHQESAERARLERAYPARYEDESPALSDAEMHVPEPFDPGAESDPETWPQDPRWDSWYATTVEPAPEPEPSYVPGIDYPQTFRPSREDREWAAGVSLARPAVVRSVPPSRRTRARWDRP